MADENKSSAAATDSTSSKAAAVAVPRSRSAVACCDIGAREEQQDAVRVWQDKAKGNLLVVVCDGVGGSNGGGKASAVVIQTAEQLWLDRSGILSDPRKDLMSLSRVAHERICDLAEAGDKRSPASTIVALYLTPKEAHWIHSGDSRLYRFRAGEFEFRTRDHSVVQVLVDQGEVNEEEMGSHPDQGRLLQSLGTKDYREPAYGTEALDAGDGFLLCTDGFWERTPRRAMASLLQSQNEQELLARLRRAIRRAVQLNGSTGDNVSAAAVAPLKVVKNGQSSERVLLLAKIAILMILLMLALLIWWAVGSKPVQPEPNPAVIQTTPQPALPAKPLPAPLPAEPSIQPQEAPAKEDPSQTPGYER